MLNYVTFQDMKRYSGRMLKLLIFCYTTLLQIRRANNNHRFISNTACISAKQN